MRGIGIVGLMAVLHAAPAGAQTTMTRDALAGADYVKGRAAFQSRCSACHTLAEGSADLAGPALFGMFGRRAGTKPGFAFSAALEDAGFDWTQDRLAAWLADPAGYLPDNVMLIPEPVPERDRLNMISFMMVESGAADWPRPATVNANADGDRGRPPSERYPSFWNHMMFNTVRYAFERPGEAEYVIDVYYNEDGSVATNQAGVNGFWHITDRDMFCYALKGLAVDPGAVVECVPVAAMSIPRFNERLWQSKGWQGRVIHGGILPGRPEVAASTAAEARTGRRPN
jgi:cytochrome c2